MEQLKCEECGKIILGYTPNHVKHLMQQHQLMHQRKKENQEEQNGKLGN